MQKEFPTQDEFFQGFCRAVKESGQEEAFCAKWGLDNLDQAYHILNDNVQGGFLSHKHTILSARTGGSVLNVGPGMGFCVFILAHLFDRVIVAEPDGQNCAILEKIASAYQVDQGKSAAGKIRIIHGGLSINPNAVKYWQRKQELMKKRKMKGSILNFSIEGAGDLPSLLTEKVQRVYLHKVLSSLSIAGSFDHIIGQCLSFMAQEGQLTWSEPGYIFRDILAVEESIPMEQALKPLFKELQITSEIEHYKLSNKVRGENLEENWMLIKAWR